MGCLKLSYYEQERDLEVNPIFLIGALEKNGIAEKKRLSSSTYGFNGMEKDDEVNGVSGSSYDFGARIYDSRLGRWLSRDPFQAVYSSISPYSFALNNPILNIDEEGNFVIEGTVAEKAMLQKFVAAAKKALASDPYLLERFQLHSGLTAKEIDFIFTDNKGPILQFKQTSNNAELEQFSKSSEFFLKDDPAVNKRAFKLNINDDFFKNLFTTSDPHKFFITMTILHELVHLGDLKNILVGELNYKKLESEGVFRKGFTATAVDESKQTLKSHPGNYVNKIEPGKAFEVDVAGYDIDNDRFLNTRYKTYQRNSKVSQKKKAKKSSQSKKSKNKGSSSRNGGTPSF